MGLFRQSISISLLTQQPSLQYVQKLVRFRIRSSCRRTGESFLEFTLAVYDGILDQSRPAWGAWSERAAQRAGDWRGFIPATLVLGHIRKLRKAGIGYKPIAAGADLAKSTRR